jgi:hypothetical protein
MAKSPVEASRAESTIRTEYPPLGRYTPLKAKKTEQRSPSKEYILYGAI